MVLDMIIPLQAAELEELNREIRDHESIVRLLLEYGADANAAYE
jgi:hypothetical protein